MGVAMVGPQAPKPERDAAKEVQHMASVAGEGRGATGHAPYGWRDRTKARRVVARCGPGCGGWRR